MRLRGRSLFAAEDRLWVARFREMGLGGHAMTALVYARRQGTISNEELRNLRHLDRDASRAVLRGLVNRGLVTTVGRGSCYALTDRAMAAAPTFLERLVGEGHLTPSANGVGLDTSPTPAPLATHLPTPDKDGQIVSAGALQRPAGFGGA